MSTSKCVGRIVLAAVLVVSVIVAWMLLRRPAVRPQGDAPAATSTIKQEAANTNDADNSPTATLEQKGHYLVNAGDCISCHTRPGGETFAGGLALATPFGTIYSANITPDPESGIGRWTEEQFTRAMRQGIAADGSRLYPAFPFPEYTKVTDEDVHAIYAYLKSLTPVKYTPPQNHMSFPFSQRSLIAIWDTLFLKDQRYQSDSSKSAEWNRGAYLVQGLGHCGACHTPRNAMGAEKDGLAFTGGVYNDGITESVHETEIETMDEDYIRPWAAVNLTSSSRGLAAWSVEDLAAYLKTGHNERAGATGPMLEVVDNSTRFLSVSDAHAMAVYLKSLPPLEQKIGKSVTPEQMKAGEIVYTVHCGDCHQSTGLGSPRTKDSDPTKIAPPLVGNAIVQAQDPASLLNIILFGAHEKTLNERSWPKMPGFEQDFGLGMDDDQVANLANFVRNSWGNRGGAVDAHAVSQQR